MIWPFRRKLLIARTVKAAVRVVTDWADVKPPTPEWHPDRLEVETFRWAFERLDGWGSGEGDKFKQWDFNARIERSQILAGYALLDPWGKHRREDTTDQPQGA